MKPTQNTCRASINRWKTILDTAKIIYTISPSGNQITILGPNKVKIQINHNGESHWTIRIPGTAKDGMRFDFNVDVSVDTNTNLIIINDILAIRYL